MLRSWGMKPLVIALFLAGLAAGARVAAADATAPADTRYPSDEALRHYVSGRWLEETGDLEGASGEFARALALDPAAVDILLQASDVASRRGEPGRSLELAQRALAISPGSARASWLEGAALFNLDRPAEALAPLRAAVAADSGQVDYLRALAHTAEALDRIELVDSCYAQLVDIDDQDAESWFQLAAADARLGRYADADSALTNALDGNPGRPGAAFLRGWIRERLGHPDEAIGLYRQHLELHPNDTTTRRRLVTLLAQQNRPAEALIEAKRVASQQPDDVNAYGVEADLEFATGHPLDGQKTLAKLRTLTPSEPDGTARSVEVLVRAGRAREAVKVADEWSADHTDDVRALPLRAWARSEADEPDSAVVLARAAVAAMPDSTGPRRALVRYLREAHRYDDAAHEIEALRERTPGDPSLLLELGMLREQQGDAQAAEQAGRDALALAPSSPTLLNFLGYLLADHDQDLSEAEGMIRRAVEQDPDNGAFVDSMGWVLYRLGQLPQARAELERALQLTGGDPVIHEHLGDVYRQMKLFDLARQQYRAVLARDARNQRIKDKLEAVR